MLSNVTKLFFEPRRRKRKSNKIGKYQYIIVFKENGKRVGKKIFNDLASAEYFHMMREYSYNKEIRIQRIRKKLG